MLFESAPMEPKDAGMVHHPASPEKRASVPSDAAAHSEAVLEGMEEAAKICDDWHQAIIAAAAIRAEIARRKAAAGEGK